MKDNKVIAEFMGLVVSDRENYTSELHTNVDADLKYHTSWDWLMPVVREVIIRYQVDEGIEIDYDELQRRVMDNDIERAYEEVVDFIKQYNDEQ